MVWDYVVVGVGFASFIGFTLRYVEKTHQREWGQIESLKEGFEELPSESRVYVKRLVSEMNDLSDGGQNCLEKVFSSTDSSSD